MKKGARFAKGDVLFVIYPDEAILSLKARKSQYQNTLASILPDLVIDFPEAEEGFKEFFSSIKVDEPLPHLPEITDDKLKIFLASRNVISEYYNIQRDELQLERRTVRAPLTVPIKKYTWRSVHIPIPEVRLPGPFVPMEWNWRSPGAQRCSLGKERRSGNHTF